MFFDGNSNKMYSCIDKMIRDYILQLNFFSKKAIYPNLYEKKITLQMDNYYAVINAEASVFRQLYRTIFLANNLLDSLHQYHLQDQILEKEHHTTCNKRQHESNGDILKTILTLEIVLTKGTP